MIKRAILGALLASALVVTPAAAQPDYADSIKADYDKSLASLWDHFHRNPELSFREFKTAARMAQELRAVPGCSVFTSCVSWPCRKLRASAPWARIRPQSARGRAPETGRAARVSDMR